VRRNIAAWLLEMTGHNRFTVVALTDPGSPIPRAGPPSPCGLPARTSRSNGSSASEAYNGTSK